MRCAHTIGRRAGNAGGRWAGACVLAVLAFGAPGCRQAPTEAVDTTRITQALASILATCAATRGDVEVLRAGQSYWEKVERGSTFRAGDWVRTGPLSFARIEFLGGHNVKLEERSVILVEEAPATDAGTPPRPLLTVESGTLHSLSASPEGETAPLMVRMQDNRMVAVCAERGQSAEFRVLRTARGTAFSVTGGRLVVMEGGSRRVLEKGAGVEFPRGEAMHSYEPLDFPPSLEPGVDARFQASPGLKVPLEWSPVDKAARYQVQVARDLGFEQLVASTTVQQTRFTFAPREEGMFVWRVAARGATGEPGEFGFARRFYVDEEGPRELLLAPADGHQAQADAPGGIVFAWKSADGPQRYRFVVARDAALRDVVVTQPLSAQQVSLTRLEPGEYYWGTYQDARQPIPLFQKARRLVVLKPARKVKLRTSSAVNRWGP